TEFPFFAITRLSSLSIPAKKEKVIREPTSQKIFYIFPTYLCCSWYSSFSARNTCCPVPVGSDDPSSSPCSCLISLLEHACITAKTPDSSAALGAGSRAAAPARDTYSSSRNAAYFFSTSLWGTNCSSTLENTLAAA
ncbi:unnamed protein product, partial [Ectocarpus sp. 12 AP-2014]